MARQRWTAPGFAPRRSFDDKSMKLSGPEEAEKRRI